MEHPIRPHQKGIQQSQRRRPKTNPPEKHFRTDNTNRGAKRKKTKNKKDSCERCGRTITEEEYEINDGLCEECHEIEIDELDYEDEHY